MKRAMVTLITAAQLALGTATANGQETPSNSLPPQLTESGRVILAGRSEVYLVHRLPVSSFPDLPSEIAELLNHRGCMIPQTYEAHRPENVVRGSLQRAGSSDWAVLCSAKGTVKLLVFFGSAPSQPMELASAQETERLQAHGTAGVLGFNWGIDAASPEQVHEAQTGMDHRPPPLSHDALADSVIEHQTVYHFYAKNAWTLLDMPE